MRKKTVLVIDADPGHRAYLKTCVEIHQALPLLAEDWQAGFEIAKTEKPDAIFVDASTSGVSEEEVARKLKSDPDTTCIPVTFLTSHTKDTPREGREAAEGCCYLSKGLDPRVFINRMPHFFPW